MAPTYKRLFIRCVRSLITAQKGTSEPVAMMLRPATPAPTPPPTTSRSPIRW